MPKADVHSELRQRVDAFVDDLTQIVRRAALDSIREALDGTDGVAVRRTRRPGRPKRRAASGPASTTRRSRGARSRRSSEDVDALSGAILAQVRANPGQSISEIGGALGATSKDLRLPVLKLTEKGQLRTTGQKRGTRYFAGGGRGRKKAGGRRKKATSRKKAGGRRKKART